MENVIRHGVESNQVLQFPPPFLKWAGGKRWLANKIVELSSPMSGKYIEPFLGSGAVFFALRPSESLLSDLNPDLINAYEAIKNDPHKIELLLKEHQRKHSKDYYYKIRDYKPRCEFRMAARFIYLNRTCWNGLYRVNKKGDFNVPIGTKSNVMMPSDDWEAISSLLKSTILRSGDFEESIEQASQGDLVFSDPPYTVKHNYNGFIKYNNALFSWSDQIRLRDALLRAKLRGVKVISTNAHHASVRSLYEKEFNLESVTRTSVLAGCSAYRGRFEELLIS